ncbi:hypothetical protein C1Y40_05154 [Mycobacterium talmoniae]|uniref:Uncharacterized protein n=1 Tax=Mycobacterium talmoniae TaxID=1858794 RepID=A0A2S8BDD8_9MYCO|nr:hypothetical protein C1Y40_05154 [Mycobacterium talmoniae]
MTVWERLPISKRAASTTPASATMARMNEAPSVDQWRVRCIASRMWHWVGV